MYQTIKFTKEQVAKLISLALLSISNGEVDLADAMLDKDEYKFALSHTGGDMVEMVFETLDEMETPGYAEAQLRD